MAQFPVVVKPVLDRRPVGELDVGPEAGYGVMGDPFKELTFTFTIASGCVPSCKTARAALRPEKSMESPRHRRFHKNEPVLSFVASGRPAHPVRRVQVAALLQSVVIPARGPANEDSIRSCQRDG